MPGELGVGVPGTVKIDGLSYVLEILNGRSVFSSGSRAIQGAPTDDFHLRIPFSRSGIGRSYYAATNIFTAVPDVLMPPPKRTAITAVGSFTGPLRYDFEEQDSNGRWYKYIVGPQAIIKVDITSNPPVARQVYTLATIAAFNANDRFGQPLKLPSAGTNYIYFPCNNGDRIVKLTTPVGIETTSAAYNPVVTLNGDITAAATSLVYTSTGDPIAAGDILLIGTEEIRAGAVNTGTNTCSSLTRAWAGTTAATHSDTAAITKKGGNDVFAAITSAIMGAAHFEQAPDGRTYRANSSHSGGTSQNRALISLLAKSANPDTDANWGDDFEVDNQTRWITALMAYADQMLIHKQDGWFTAVLQPDNTLDFETLLPDERSVENVALGAETTHRGTVWHGQAFLPSRSLWRSVITAARPVGPDSISDNETTDMWGISNTLVLKFGRIPTAIGIGSWLYTPYMSNSNNLHLLAGRETETGDIEWFPLYFEASPSASQYVGLQTNGAGAPRIFYARSNAAICHFPVTIEGSPAVLDDTQDWDSSDLTSRSWISKSILFPSTVLLREMEYIIESYTNTAFLWGLNVHLDGGSAVTIKAAASGLSATGSIFWTPGTSDQCRRLRVSITTNSGTLTNIYNPPILRAAILHGTYLPDVSDELQFVIDVPATADMRGMSEKGVYDEVRALVSGGAKAWVDLYAQSGYVAIRSTQEQAPPSMHPLVGRPVITVSATLLEY